MGDSWSGERTRQDGWLRSRDWKTDVAKDVAQKRNEERGDEGEKEKKKVGGLDYVAGFLKT